MYRCQPTWGDNNDEQVQVGVNCEKQNFLLCCFYKDRLLWVNIAYGLPVIINTAEQHYDELAKVKKNLKK